MKDDTYIHIEDFLKKEFDDKINFSCEFGELTIEFSYNLILDISNFLKNNNSCLYEQLIDLCGVDYLNFGIDSWKTSNAKHDGYSRAVIKNEYLNKDKDNRFVVVYHLLSLKYNTRLRMKVFVPKNMIIDSVISIWPSANWFEREAYDLFGIIFKGHNNLNRILTDYNFKGNPLRKDFPTIGNVEIRYDNNKREIVYEPVSIKHRENVPKVIRG